MIVYSSFFLVAVLKYSSLHSVVELGSESEYKNCNIGNAVNSMSSGNDVCEIEQAYHTLLCMWYNGSLRSRHEGEDHNSV